ncbi:DUF402 domain-containing protein [Corynebacterium pseudokroppenstedtii]|uniref:DUF402 domain-containing protein n=1 Tax=Corynebacterium pseudokroppenstedtii TaxID=2804917 RepID=UPI0030798510
MQSPNTQPHHGATHAPKHETFDIDSKTNIDPKGFTRAVDQYVETPFGLYMGRGADHPRFGYIEAWLLREPDIRITKFHFRPETKASEPLTGRQEFYIDIAHNSRDSERPMWTTTDYYADIVLYSQDPGAHGRYSMEILDLDELEDAYTQGFISDAELAHALSVTSTVVDGLTTYGDISSWLEQFNITLTWKNADNISLTPAP